MKKVIIFGGTTEGRKLAEALEQQEILCIYCVATEYGKEPVKESQCIKLHAGRLDADGMVSLYECERPDAIVDATHPFAEVVKKEIENSLNKYKSVPFFRLARDEENVDYSNCNFFDNADDCAKALEETEGKIFLTTGSKELPVFCQNEQVKERIVARIIPNQESLDICKQQGLKGNQILAMQGPFSRDMNIACFKEYDAAVCVLKESGKAGGEASRIEAANACGIGCFIIKRPEEAFEAMSFNEVLDKLYKLFEIRIEASAIPGEAVEPITAAKKLSVSLAGYGMGFGTLTTEVTKKIAEADYIFGAPRLLEDIESKAKKYPYYLAKDILPALAEIAGEVKYDKKNVVILFSGDTGFYSGAAKMKEALDLSAYVETEILPGISSINAIAAKAAVKWQDCPILSTHGIEEDQWRPALLEAVKHNKYSFVITSGNKDVRLIGELLLRLQSCEMGMYRIFIGTNLYSDEKLGWYDADKCSTYDVDGLSTLIIHNKEFKDKILVPCLTDEDFIRDNVPMSKEEIRQLSLCKLRLSKNSVVYDIGSGSGSVAVEIGRTSPGIKVYAIEVKNEACELTKKNADKFLLENVTVVEGAAPEAFEGIPKPTHVFIGGSGGRLEDIIKTLKDFDSPMRIVINAVTIETIAEISGVLKKYEIEGADIAQVTVSKAKRAGDYSIMQGQNPVYIVSFDI
jgi:precorrin-6Y C5,15-methyltransferase (decarboxylating)